MAQPEPVAPAVDALSRRNGTGIDRIRQIVSLSDSLIDELRNLAFEPDKAKQLKRRYSITQVADMVGRSANGIRKAESNGALPKPAVDDKGRRTGYTLADVNRIREHFNIQCGRLDHEEPIRLAIQNFKGGVGKSTLCTHFAQYLAERGMRVLVIDCDSQASTTTTFGIRPDLDLQSGDTLLPYFEYDQPDLAYAVRTTYWDRLDIIPANLSLYSAEYELAANAGQSGAGWIDRLHEGISTIENNYDVVIIDPPPALGMISLNVVRAANALVIPTPPAMYDFHSTVTFFRMMEEVLSSVEDAIGEPLNYKFMKLLISKFDPGKSAQEFMVNLMSDHYSRYILNGVIKDSAEIDNAGADWHTVYELEKATTSSKTYKRCLVSLNSVFKELELLIRSSWGSHSERLEEEGVMIREPGL